MSRSPARPDLKQRTWPVLAIGLAVMGAAAGLIALNESRRTAELAALTPPAPLAGVGAPFDLIDQNGRPTTDRSFAGRRRVIIFAPLDASGRARAALQVISSARELLGPSLGDTAFIWINTEPGDNMPARMTALLQDIAAPWTALTGPSHTIEALARAFYVPTSRPAAGAGVKGTPPPPATTAFLMDANGAFLSHRTVPPDPVAFAQWLGQSL